MTESDENDERHHSLPTRWLHSVGGRLLIRILLFSLLVAVPLTAFQLYIDLNNSRERLARQLIEIERSYSQSLGESLWSLNARQLYLQAVGILAFPAIQVVEVREVGAIAEPLTVVVGTPSDEAALVHEVAISCFCGGARREVGLLHIEADLDAIYGTMFDRTLLTFGSMGAKALLVGLFSFYLVHRMVTRHLVDLAEATERSDPLLPKPPFRLNRRPLKVPDELNRVLDAVNLRDIRLQRTIRELKVAKEALERQQVELAKSERYYRQLIDALPVGVYTLDSNGRLTMFNKAVTAMTGRRATLGMPVDKTGVPMYWPDGRLVTVEDSPSMMALRTGCPASEVEAVLPCADGRQTHILVYPTPLFDTDGSSAGVVCVHVDVTALKSAEASLRETSQRLAATLDNLPGVAYRMVYTSTGRHLEYISEACRTFLGRSPEAMCAMSPEELAALIHPDDFFPASAAYRELLETGRLDRNARLKGTDGAWVWVNFRARVVEHRGEDLVIDGLFLDVTAEIQAKHDLEESERRYRAMLDVIPVGVHEDDLVAGNVFVNETWVRLSGRSRAELAGDGWTRAVHPDDRSEVVSRWNDIITNQKSGRDEFRLVQPDGTIIWVLSESIPQRKLDGTLVGYIGTVTDITDRREIEQERRRMEETLREAQHLETLGLLASGIAHDFNNLLGAITGFARFIIEDAEPGSSVLRYARRINSAGQRGQALIGQILAVGRRTEIRQRNFLLADLVAETKELLRASIPASTQIVGPDNGNDMIVSADPDQVAQVLMNLCLNAHDALRGHPGTIGIAINETNTGTKAFRRLAKRTTESADAAAVEVWVDDLGTVWTTMGSFDKDIPYVSLVVSDTGAGMSRELAENVLTPFFTTKERGRGTGLGLAVVQGITLAHGGAIVVASRPDEGTRFEVALPAGVGMVETVGPRPDAVPDATGGRLLLVDDDPDFGDMLMEALERHGFEVAPCADPFEALEGIRSAPDAWDAVVSDQTMPGMSGIDLIRSIKAIRPDLPCVLCSGYAENVDGHALEAADVLRLFPKPVKFGELVDTLANAVTRKASTVTRKA